MNPEMVRVVVQFTAKELERVDLAVDKLNQKPGERATRSDVVRSGTLQHAMSILGLTREMSAAENEQGEKS